MTKRKKSEYDIDLIALEMIQMQIAGASLKEIGEKYGMHPNSVSRKINSSQKKLKMMFEASEAASGQSIQVHTPNPKSNITLRQSEQPTGAIDAMIVNTTNAFNAISDLSQLSQTSVASGAIPGCAITLMASGLTEDPNRTRDERFDQFMKGIVSGAGFVFGLVESMREGNKMLQAGRKPNNTRTVERQQDRSDFLEDDE